MSRKRLDLACIAGSQVVIQLHSFTITVSDIHCSIEEDEETECHPLILTVSNIAHAAPASQNKKSMQRPPQRPTLVTCNSNRLVEVHEGALKTHRPDTIDLALAPDRAHSRLQLQY